MRIRRLVHACAGLALLTTAFGAAELFAAATEAQKQQIAAAVQSLKELPALLKAGEIEESSERLGAAQTLLSDLSQGDAKHDPRLAVLEKKVAAGELLLKRKSAANKPKPAPRAKPKKPAPAKPTANEISFTKQVFPIFNARCANCHIQMAKGGFSMATFADLKKGSEGGTVFQPGKAEGSRLMDVLQSGDMPRGGVPLSPAELTLIAAWINAGAKFDGPSESAPLAAPRPANPGETPSLQAVRASGNESVQFIRDLGAIVVGNCVECHSGMQPAGRLNLSTFSGLLRGGDSGAAIVPGKAADSLLIKKLRGTAGDRMPLRRDPLAEEVIKKFEQWIADGAKYDWADLNESIDVAVRTMVASKMTHEELAAMRSDLAEKTWRLANPDVAPVKLEAEQFILLGNLSTVRMTELAELAKTQQGKVAKLLQVRAGQPFVKGKVTLFALAKHFDYTEFGTMVERRELPADWRAHWRYNIIDCYGCLVASVDDDQSLPLLLALDFAGAYLENQGKMPRWFSLGAARVIAARAEPKDPLGKLWHEQAKEAVAAGRTADEFLKAGDVLSGESAAMSYDFMKSLMTKMPKFKALLDELHKGAEFEAAFRKHFGGDPAALAAAWANSAAYGR
ncbi:MAG TPA: c-type cytochrome domain-containing protein [Pirellulales bacterium]|nr:c-type cytochrome domain-containing protein [Pirellulales bacterium]